MSSNDPITNSILHRANSNADNPPFLVPIKDTLSTPFSASKVFNSNSKVYTASSRKSIKMLRPETMKRANNDACMAAAIGDLAWLQQTLKISDEIAFDKNGFATIHLASIHGRINIIKYLIEEKNFDPNFPSTHGWRPVHLCISNQIGARAIECLNYLLEQGADLNVKNNDGVYPIHMAASEGQIECLKILLELKADTRVVDNKNQTPLDLAKLWGHRTCAKLLAASIWHKDKEDITQEYSLVRKLRTQDILKEIEQAHFAQFNSKEESEKKFDTWLTNQGFVDKKSTPEFDTKIIKKNLKKNNLDLVQINSSMSKNSRLLTSITPKDQLEIESSSTPYSIPISHLPSMPNLNDRDITARTKKSGPPLRKYKRAKTPEEPWNYSTKAKENDYITNLKDFFPRDPYTKLPENLDLALLNTELKGMTLEEVKDFMKKKLVNNPKALKNYRNSSPGMMEDHRPVYYVPKNIIDTQTKIKLPENTPTMDIAAFSFGNDINSFQFREAKRFVEKSQNKKSKTSSHGNYYKTEDTLKQIKNLLSTKENNNVNQLKDEQLEIVRKKYGKDLADFMTDKRHGKMSQKYEKVFIC